MAKCTVCRKQFTVPFWKLATLCPECRSAQLELHAQLKGLTPVFIVTPCLVGVNGLVFCLMVVSGVPILNPDLAQLVQWGANFGALSLGSQPWRAVTSMFVHIGIIHILFNMWCLWSLGQLAERLMGNWNFLILYLLSGVGGSLLSLWLHPQLVSAGASGAIFGVAGGLIALLGMKKAQIPGAAMKRTLKSLLFFVGYNLLYGMRGGIDNAAHLGGLLSGAALGAFLPQRSPEATSVPGSSLSPQMTWEAPNSSRFRLAGAALACLLLAGFGFVRRAHGPTPSREEAVELELFKMGKQDRASLQEAVKLLQDGQTDRAIDKLKTVTVDAPASSMAHAVLGEAYNQKKQYHEAISELHQAIVLNPNDAVAHRDLAGALLESRQYDPAIEEYRAALRLDPKNAGAHNNLGVALERKGDARGAFEEYRSACGLDPGNATYKKNYERLSPQVNK